MLLVTFHTHTKISSKFVDNSLIIQLTERNKVNNALGRCNSYLYIAPVDLAIKVIIQMSNLTRRKLGRAHRPSTRAKQAQHMIRIRTYSVSPESYPCLPRPLWSVDIKLCESETRSGRNVWSLWQLERVRHSVPEDWSYSHYRSQWAGVAGEWWVIGTGTEE